MKSLRLPTWARASFSAVLLIALIWWAGPGVLLDSLGDLLWGWLVLSILVNYVAMSVGALNVAVLTRVLLPQTRWSRTASAFLRSWAVGMIAPGKSGDLSYAHFLSGDTTNLAPGLAVAIVDKIVTFLVTSVVAIIGLGIYVGAADAAYGAAFAAAATAVALYLLLGKRPRALLGARFFTRYATRFEGFGGHVRALLLERKDVLALNIGLTILRMLVISVVIALEFRALRIDVPFMDVIVVQAVTQLVSLVPVTLSGLGVRQGTAVVLFEHISGIAAPPVVNQSLILTLMSYVNVAAIFAVLGMSRSGGRVPEEVPS